MGGTGLGLSIVKHLVQVLGGSVRLNSKVGKGSEFQIRVPAAKK
jgi:two-component system phosphate regulon sensor histidine kinase PhoR